MTPMTLPGTLTIDDLRRLVEGGAVDTVLLTFTDCYGRQMGKRLDAGFFLENAASGTHACDYLLTVDLNMDPVPGYQLSSWERGYGDFHMVPDLSTMRVASWLDRTALILCDLHHRDRHEFVAPAPRSILRRQVEQSLALGLPAHDGQRARILHLQQLLPPGRRRRLQRP